jgi:hypothetical protein
MRFIFSDTIHVDAFCLTAGLEHLFPIAPANEFLPEWWKQLPATIKNDVGNGIVTETGTLKKCVGLLDLYRNGFMIPLWSELKIKTNEDGSLYHFASAPVHKQDHDPRQLNSAFDNSIHFKMASPWLIKEKSGVQFLWHGCEWNYVEALYNISVSPGIVEYKYQHNTHINMFLPRKNIELTLEAGTPLVHIVPLSEKKVVIHNQFIDQREYDRLFSASKYPLSFTGQYKKRKAIMKSNESKCPFGFGK